MTDNEELIQASKAITAILDDCPSQDIAYMSLVSCLLAELVDSVIASGKPVTTDNIADAFGIWKEVFDASASATVNDPSFASLVEAVVSSRSTHGVQ